jgi:hypothetical protein
MVGFHLMKDSFWKTRVRPPKTTNQYQADPEHLVTLPWRNQTQAIWATVAVNDDHGGEQDGRLLGVDRSRAEQRGLTQLAASSGFFSEYLKAAKKRMTGKRSKSSFMAGHYILPETIPTRKPRAYAYRPDRR